MCDMTLVNYFNSIANTNVTRTLNDVRVWLGSTLGAKIFLWKLISFLISKHLISSLSYYYVLLEKIFIQCLISMGYLYVYGILHESLSPKHLKSYRINPNILNIGNLEKQRCWFATQKVKLHPNKPLTFLLLYALINEKTVKLMQIDKFLTNHI